VRPRQHCTPARSRFCHLGVYGIVPAPGARANRYSLLGGLRSTVQMIHELSLGLSIVAVVLRLERWSPMESSQRKTTPG